MNLRFPTAAIGFIMGKITSMSMFPFLGLIGGYELGALLDDKEVDGEKIIKGFPSENGSYPNFKRTQPNSIRWISSANVLARKANTKKDFYVNNFAFNDRRIKSHFSFLGKLWAKRIEKKDLYANWRDLKKGSLIVGSMGQGKTVFIMNMMYQFTLTNRRIVAHDTKGELTEYFYRHEKDYIINHLEDRGVYWDFYLDNERGLPLSLILDFFHAFFIAVAGDMGDKYWLTMASLRFEEFFNEVKVDDEIPSEKKMDEFIHRILFYFDLTRKGSNKTEQSIAATLEGAFDIFLKMLFMKNRQDDNQHKLFLFTDFFMKPSDSRIFLHTIEEVSRANIPFISAFLTLLYKMQLSTTDPKEEEHILYALDEYLTFYSLLGRDLKKSLHTKARSSGALLLPAIQYFPKDEEDRKNLLGSVENLYLFAVTDPDTKKKVSEFIGQTRITRLNKTSTKNADLREEKIDLIDENTMNILQPGYHISYHPKDYALLYVAYTKQPNIPKIAKGYIRQDYETERKFIEFKQSMQV